MPQFAAAGGLVTAAGGLAVSSGYQVGWWAAVGGGLALLTTGLMFWRALPGLAVATPLWLLFAGVAVNQSVSARVGVWLVSAGGVALVSLVAVGVNRKVGLVLAAGAWSVYAALVLRALTEEAQAHRWWSLLLACGLVVLLATLVGLVRSRASSRASLRRLGRAGRVNDGMASTRDLVWTVSAWRLRRMAKVLRPSMKSVPLRKRLRMPITELGTRLARVGWFFGVHSPCEDATIRFGGPRVGKSVELACRVLDAPGAVVVTSTRTDLLENTAELRARRGPIWVFNPSGLGDGVASTITFDPLAGCTDAAVVMNRAADLIAGAGTNDSDDGARWGVLATQALTAVMHAAALGGYTMQDVQRWVADPGQEAKELVLFELRNAEAHAFVQQASQFFDNNPRTRSSISTTIMPALSWLSIPSAVAAATPGGVQLDVERLLAEHGSLYLLGKDDKHTAPLVTALTAHMAREARAIASRQPKQRLDPQLTLVLDEAAIICLVPLDQWTADMGGFNITIHIGAQSRAQLRDRFGEAAAGAMISNCSTVLLFGAMKDDDDLSSWSTLTGERQEDVATKDRDTGAASVTNRRVAVLTAAQIGQLRAGQVLILSRAIPPVIGRAPRVWKRRDVRKLARQHWYTERYEALAAALDRWGWRYINASAWLFEHGVRALEYAAAAGRPLRRRTAARLAAGLDWLDANDPARELVARLRLSGAMRKARAALDARAATERSVPIGERTDSEGGQR